MEWNIEVEHKMQTYLNENEREKFGKHVYSLDMFGLEEINLDSSFSEYRNYFNINKSER